MFGCRGPIEPQLDVRYNRFRDCPWRVPHCPNRLTREAGPELHAALNVAADYQAGVVQGWPERFSAGLVDAVRYYLGETNAAQAAVWELDS